MDKEVLSVTLVRFTGSRRLTGYYCGNAIISLVTTEAKLTLLAHSEQQLANMINIASVDGWRVR